MIKNEYLLERLNSRFDSKDHEFFQLLQKAGGEVAKPDLMSMRVTKNFRWALEIYKRAYDAGLSDFGAIQHLIWSFAILDNPLVPSSKIETIKKGKITKFFLESYDKNSGEDIDFNVPSTINWKYISSIELTWSVFHIFRIIKLYLVDKSLLLDNEKIILEFIEDKKLFWVDGLQNFKEGYLRTNILTQVFTSSGKNPDDFINALILKSSRQEIIGSLEAQLQEVTHSPKEDEEIKSLIDKNEISIEYIYRDQSASASEDFYKKLAIDYFPVEIKRLRVLMEKEWNFDEVRKMVEMIEENQS